MGRNLMMLKTNIVEIASLGKRPLEASRIKYPVLCATTIPSNIRKIPDAVKRSSFCSERLKSICFDT